MAKKKIKAKQIFAEVLTDYTTPEGNITIDAFPDTNPDSENGRVVAEVTPDGKTILGTNPEITEVDLLCPLVIEAIKEARIIQEERKEKLADDVLEQIKDDALNGDYEVLYELLKMVPSKNLIQALPEERWTNYPIEIK